MAGSWCGCVGVIGNTSTLGKPGTVTVAGKMSKDLAPRTWSSILKQAGLDKGDSS